MKEQRTPARRLQGESGSAPKHCCTLKTLRRLQIWDASTHKHTRSAALIFSAAMERQVRVRGSLLSGWNSGFDMWHDYMKLGCLLKRLADSHRDSGEGDSDIEASKRQTAAAPWSHIRTSPNLETSSASVSSLSDSSWYCGFCKQNGESPRVYRSHNLKSDYGKVTCPILWNYTCPICEATGERAHTRRYCPQAQRLEAGRMLPGSRSW
uniref:Nanos-type domain-containing protein n=1 Tax=Sander lucioperca TaxID=283035 RepID=A0A8D0DD92_SANLU